MEAISEFIGQQPRYYCPYELPEPPSDDGSEGSTSAIQRKFSIGYNRAGRITDQLEKAGIVSPTAAEPQQMNPYYFLNLYKSGFDLKMRTEGTNYVVTMTSQKKKGVKQMEVTINQKTYLPSRVVMTSQRGSKTTVTISNLKKGKKLPDSTFRFNKKEHPKVQVIDLR